MKRAFLILLYLIIFTSLSAQEKPKRLYRQIRTVEAMQELQNKYPETSKRQSQIERFIHKNGKLVKDKKVTLPLVFHILYTSEKDRVTLEQIEAQIEALNRDFANQEKDRELEVDQKEGFTRRATDTEISFCLADTDGKFPAINYVQTSMTGWDISNSIKGFETGGADPVDPDHYINVWAADLAHEVSGYAQMPGGPIETDGIVIDFRFLGTSDMNVPYYNEGKTLTHLMGNYLNLYPLWGQYNCTDDYVFDTPVHNSPNINLTGYKHISTCDGNPVEMLSNFMDNTDDQYLHFFTHGQKFRMQAVLAKGGPRAGLTNSKVECQDIEELLPPEHFDTNELGVSVQPDTSPSMRLFPNPADQTTNLEILTQESGVGYIRVFDLSGRLHYAQEVELVSGTQQVPIECQDWQGGIYVFHVLINGTSLSDRLIIK